MILPTTAWAAIARLREPYRLFRSPPQHGYSALLLPDWVLCASTSGARCSPLEACWPAHRLLREPMCCRFPASHDPVEHPPRLRATFIVRRLRLSIGSSDPFDPRWSELEKLYMTRCMSPACSERSPRGANHPDQAPQRSSVRGEAPLPVHVVRNMGTDLFGENLSPFHL